MKTLKRILKSIAKLGIKLHVVPGLPLDAKAATDIDAHSIYVVDTMGEKQTCGVLLHELAHLLGERESQQDTTLYFLEEVIVESACKEVIDQLFPECVDDEASDRIKLYNSLSSAAVEQEEINKLVKQLKEVL